MITATSSDDLTYTDKPLVVCFTNPISCVPCAAFKPHYAKVEGALSSVVDFYEVDITTAEGYAVAEEFGIMGTPTVLLIDEQGQRPLIERRGPLLIGEINERLAL